MNSKKITETLPLTPEIINKYSNKIVLSDKPLDFTSADAVYVLKKYFKVKKAGHAGTLDPRATGLLIVCTDKMTKSINNLMTLEKDYEGIFRIGATTRTFDTESQEENIKETGSISIDDVLKVRDKFMGETDQIPPIYSALKINGKPVYELARAGEKVELKPRKIVITKFDVKIISPTEIFFSLTCSKGTYIRSIANSFGEYLGTGAYLKTLRRTRIGDFSISDFEDEVKGIKFKVL